MYSHYTSTQAVFLLGVMIGKVDNLIGQKFGMLTVIARAENKDRSAMWICKCDCGKIKENPVCGWSLKSGKTRSCGCLYKGSKKGRVITHGKTNTELYRRYCHIIDRCYCESHTAYKNYGGRGIKVCDEWRNDFNAFYEWALSNGFSKELTIDRVDVNGSYCPENCRWVSMKEQCNNRRNTVKITIKGQTKSVSEWAELNNLDRTTLKWRLKHGWKEEDLLIPANSKQKGE